MIDRRLLFWISCAVLLAVAGALRPASAATTVFLSTSDTDPTPANPTLDVTHRDTGSLYVWVTTDSTIHGMGLSIEALTAGIVSGTGFEIFNPVVDTIDSTDVPRWQGVTTGTLGELVDNSNAVFVAPATAGQGIDGVGGETANPYFVGPDSFLFGRIDFAAEAVGSTQVRLTSGFFGIADDLGNPIDVLFGAGEPGTVVSTADATGSVLDGLINVLPRLGDLDGDGYVAQTDLDLLLADWRMTGSLPADLNNDQIVNDRDLGLLLGAWTGVDAAIVAIPEPTAALLLIGGAIGLIGRRHRLE